MSCFYNEPKETNQTPSVNRNSENSAREPHVNLYKTWRIGYFWVMSFGRRQPKQEVSVNVYDLTPGNANIRCLGVGFYHSGLVVGGCEYSFAGHPINSTGVFKNTPRVVQNAPGQEAQFYRNIPIGISKLTASQIQSKLSALKERFIGKSYNLIRRNCNHFADEFCRAIMDNQGIPGWINRLSCLACPV